MEDPAFVWQRPDQPARPMQPPSRARESGRASIRWVTLHEAEEATGVPASTVRNWARKDRVPTRFELAPEGQVRMVGLDEVVARARHLGRLRPEPPAAPRPAPSQRPSAQDQPPSEAPAESVLVPVDAWNRMINQLGNLHEAGQQLAEARERAARAETEAEFLRERLGELRRQVQRPAEAPPVAPEPELSEPSEPEPGPPEVEPAWLYLFRRWENRGRRRR